AFVAAAMLHRRRMKSINLCAVGCGEGDHDAVAGAGFVTVERLAHPYRLAVALAVDAVADERAVVGKALVADGAEHRVVECAGLRRVARADRDVTQHPGPPNSCAGRVPRPQNKSRTISSCRAPCSGSPTPCRGSPSSTASAARRRPKARDPWS